MAQVTIVESVAGGERYDVVVEAGMTTREAVAVIRAAGRSAFGDIGGMEAALSDGSFLCVELQGAVEKGCRLMNSQRIVRREFNSRTGSDKILRVYPW
jgi:hypothetical protein